MATHKSRHRLESGLVGPEVDVDLKHVACSCCQTDLEPVPRNPHLIPTQANVCELVLPVCTCLYDNPSGFRRIEIHQTDADAPLRREEQPDGRVRFWGEVTCPGEAATRVLRVVTLADGETIHNAFFDRRFRKDYP